MRREFAALAFLILFCVGTGLAEPRFFAAQSVSSILQWMPLITIVAIGQLFVILTGGIDISVGSIVGFSGIAVGLLVKANPTLPLPLILGSALLVGFALGSINASLITWAKISPLIVTIGTLATFRGLTFLLSKGEQIDGSMLPDSLMALAKNGIGIGQITLSWLLLGALFVAFVAAILLRKTVGGANVLAAGSNPVAAHLRGISLNSVTFWVYALSGALAGLGGAVYAARFGFVNPNSAGQNLELTVIAAVAIGGTKLTGGSGSVAGVLLGCLLLSCINVGLTVLGIDANWQLLAYGTVILVAILVDGFARRGTR